MNLAAGSGKIPQLAVTLGTVDASLDAVEHRALATADCFRKLRHRHQVIVLALLVKKTLHHSGEPVDLRGKLPYLLLLCHFSLVTQVSTIPLLLTTNS